MSPVWPLRLHSATTRQQAQAVARRALQEGAAPADVAAALMAWDQLEDQSVTTWEAS